MKYYSKVNKNGEDMEKICVYTCITGNYDNLKDVLVKEDNVDYICFTDNKYLSSSTWKIIYIEDKTLTAHYLSRKIKMLGHPYIDENYDLSIWIDASIIFKRSVNEFLGDFFDIKNDLLAACKHNCRNSIKEEALECIRLAKDNEDIIKKQLKLYEEEKFPDNLGLLEMTLIIKRHNNELVKRTMKLWFDMILKYSKRDQLSFMYCLYKTKLPFKIIPLNVWDNDYLEFQYHNKNRFDYTYQVFYSNDQEFNEKDSFKNNYKCDNGKYVIEFSPSKDINKLRIDLADIAGVAFTFNSFQGITKKDLKYEEFLFYNDSYVTFSDDSQIIINKKIKKGTKIKIVLDIKVLSPKDLIDISKFYINENNELKTKIDNVQLNNDELRNELSKILDSKSWKILEKIRSIINKFRKLG